MFRRGSNLGGLRSGRLQVCARMGDSAFGILEPVIERMVGGMGISIRGTEGRPGYGAGEKVSGREDKRNSNSTATKGRT